MGALQNSELKNIMRLCYYGHPALRKKCHDSVKIDGDIKELTNTMIRTMKANDGIGLAASQVGKLINVIVLNIPENNNSNNGLNFLSPGEVLLLPQMPLAIINTKLTKYSEDKSNYTEGCLSIPGVTAEVLRPNFVHLEAELLNGSKVSCYCGGLLSRCLQHEHDHINGILFVDLISKKDFYSIEGKLREVEKTYTKKK